ncbi:adenylosuccinate synthase [Coprothermobacteraceae bacterium]|nr:adenylosuccinate synthase [Coprothermobacteraceae bacterium]
MSADLIIGLQWGDEGKGKAVDYVSPNYDIVVRYNGGDNAGHTVVHRGRTYKFHLVPSGILHGATGVIATGVVVNPDSLREELSQIDGGAKLLVSHRCHLILPSYSLLDRHLEGLREGKVGTTGRGIGPAYGLKALRFGLRVGDLFEATLPAKLKEIRRIIEYLGVEWIEPDIAAWQSTLEPHVGDEVEFLHKAWNEGKRILFEGAQGVLLDLDFGTYPFVTSSYTFSDGLHPGSGFFPGNLEWIVGVAKAYTTRVGNGSFPSELSGDLAELIRTKGAEFGTTTGRPRRVGWLDLVALRYAVKLSRTNLIFLTKVDVLDGLDRIGVVDAYDIDGQRVQEWHDFGDTTLSKVRPVINWLDGWSYSYRSGEMHPAVLRFKAYIENSLNVRVGWMSFGPRDDETLCML